MTGAGAGTVCFAVEDSYGTLSADPTWYQPGIDIEVGSASLNRALARARHPDDPRPAGSRPGNREGALSVTFTLTDVNFHDLVFADGGTGLAQEAMLAPTATWYLGADVIGDTEDRFATGAAVESVAWNWQQGEGTVSVDLTIIYGDEGDLSVPSSIEQPSVSDVAGSYATDFQLNAAAVGMEQSITLEVAGMARFRRGPSQTPVDAVVGAYDPSLSVEAILSDGTQRELAYGSSSATEPADEIDTSSATLGFSNAAGSVAEYDLSNLQPTSYDWSNLVAADADITEPVDYHLTDVQVA